MPPFRTVKLEHTFANGKQRGRFSDSPDKTTTKNIFPTGVWSKNFNIYQDIGVTDIL